MFEDREDHTREWYCISCFYKDDEDERSRRWPSHFEVTLFKINERFKRKICAETGSPFPPAQVTLAPDSSVITATGKRFKGADNQEEVECMRATFL